ncbi:mediator complex subunit, partial [Ascosphaera aggregata]
MNLRRENDLYFDHHVLEVNHNPTTNTLTLFFDDGNISTYDLRTFLPAAETGDSMTVTSLANTGFNFPPAPNALYCTFSANSCLTVTMDIDHELQLLYAKHDLMDHDDEPEDKGQVLRIAATMALSYARSYGSGQLSDDIIASVINTFKHQSTRLKFVHEVYNALPIIRDINDERNKEILSNPYVPRCLSIQAALGYKSFYE